MFRRYKTCFFVYFTAALKIESPTRVTVIRSLQIVISFIVQIQAWDERPGVDQVTESSHFAKLYTKL